MTGAPPLLGRAVLWLCLPSSERESVPGDLHEEFQAIAREQGTAGARRWFLRQAMASALPLLSQRWRQGEMPRLLLIALAGFALPLRVLDLAWTFILSQVPLKADSIRSLDELLIGFLCAGGLALLAGYMAALFQPSDEVRGAACAALLIMGAAWLCVLLSPGRLPWWFETAVVALAPQAALAGGVLRRRDARRLGVPT